MVNWVGGAIVGLHMGHLEPTRNRLIEDESGERLGGLEVDIVRGLLSVHLQLDKPTVDFFELAFVVVGPSVLGDPGGRVFRRI